MIPAIETKIGDLILSTYENESPITVICLDPLMWIYHKTGEVCQCRQCKDPMLGTRFIGDLKISIK